VFLFFANQVLKFCSEGFSDLANAGSRAPQKYSSKSRLNSGPVQTTESKSAFPFVAVPGEIPFVARPLSFFERLLYPIMKE
jgi:hypothetical protein